jgi:hypothetical protein
MNKNTSLNILGAIKESVDYPKFEEDLMNNVKAYLENLAKDESIGISDIKVFYNIEGSYVCQYTLDGENFIVSVDMI